MNISNNISTSFYNKSNLYAYTQVIVPLFFLTLTFVWIRYINSVFEIGLAFLIIGYLQYRLYFPLHDCSHNSLFQSKIENRFWGILLASLLFVTFDSFKDEHMIHHRNYGSLKDPGSVDYWVKFKTRRDLVFFFLTPLWGGGAAITKISNYFSFFLPVHQSEEIKSSSAKMRVLPIIGVQVLIFIFISSGFHEPLKYSLYFFPAGTVFLFFSRVRMFLEHASLDYSQFDYFSNPYPLSRTHISMFPENQILCGMNFNYHYEHHLFPQVPSNNLKKLHREVTSAYIKPLELGNTYINSLAQIWKNLG